MRAVAIVRLLPRLPLTEHACTCSSEAAGVAREADPRDRQLSAQPYLLALCSYQDRLREQQLIALPLLL
jgi:hypothetical protein